jgi:hypothetical protein
MGVRLLIIKLDRLVGIGNSFVKRKCACGIMRLLSRSKDRVIDIESMGFSFTSEMIWIKNFNMIMIMIIYGISSFCYFYS